MGKSWKGCRMRSRRFREYARLFILRGPLPRFHALAGLELADTNACASRYHMYNFRRNPSYKLPPMLKPTALQQSTPHDRVIDAFPFPGLRDGIVLNQGMLCCAWRASFLPAGWV